MNRVTVLFRRFYLHELNESFSRSTMPNSLSPGETSESSLGSVRLWNPSPSWPQQPHQGEASPLSTESPSPPPQIVSNLTHPFTRPQITSSYLPVSMNSTPSPQLVPKPLPHLQGEGVPSQPHAQFVPPPTPYLPVDRPVCEIVPPSQPQIDVPTLPDEDSSLPPLLDIMLLPSAPSHDVIILPNAPIHDAICESDRSLSVLRGVVTMPEAVEISKRGVAMATRRNRSALSARGALTLPESVLPQERRKSLVNDAISLELSLRMSILVHVVSVLLSVSLCLSVSLSLSLSLCLCLSLCLSLSLSLSVSLFLCLFRRSSLF
jgi:hypothetical protein